MAFASVSQQALEVSGAVLRAMGELTWTEHHPYLQAHLATTPEQGRGTCHKTPDRVGPKVA